MAFLLAGMFWSALALLVGLITGTPTLRTFGAVALAGFFALALLVDHFSAPAYDDRLDENDEADWRWPSRKDDRAA